MTPHSQKGYPPFLLSGEGGIRIEEILTIAVAIAMFVLFIKYWDTH